MSGIRLLLIVLLLVLLSISCAGTPRMAANSGKLHLAAQSGDRAAIESSLQSGGDVNQADNYGMTPLSYAAATPNSAIVEYLLGKGADPNHVADDGETPLLIAARKANLPVVELLIKKGARIDGFSEDGSTALTIAVEKGEKNLFDSLMNLGAKPNVSVANCDTTLIKSIQQKDATFFERLVGAGADSNLKGRAGNTPLIMAVITDKPDIADKLLSAGARINDVNDYGYSALHFGTGIKGLNPAVVKLLVEKGADINKAARDGLTPLKAACQTGQADMAAYLYEKGANPNMEDASDEGMEINGTVHHVLGDYFLAQDNLDKARASFVKTGNYYQKLIDKYNGDVNSLAWKQVGQGALVAVGMVFLAGAAVANPSNAGVIAGQLAASTSSSGRRNQLSNQPAQISDMKSASQTNIGVQSYNTYMVKYNQAYVPTYSGINMAYVQPPSDTSPINVKKAYAKEKAARFEERSALISRILECFDKNPGGGTVLHACVNTPAKTTKPDDPQEK